MATLWHFVFCLIFVSQSFRVQIKVCTELPQNLFIQTLWIYFSWKQYYSTHTQKVGQQHNLWWGSQAEVFSSFVNEAEEVVKVLGVSVVAPFLGAGHHNRRGVRAFLRSHRWRVRRCVDLVELHTLHFPHVERALVTDCYVQLGPHRPGRVVVRQDGSS